MVRSGALTAMNRSNSLAKKLFNTSLMLSVLHRMGEGKRPNANNNRFKAIQPGKLTVRSCPAVRNLLKN